MSFSVFLGLVIAGLGVWQIGKWCDQASPDVKDAATGGIAKMIERFTK